MRKRGLAAFGAIGLLLALLSTHAVAAPPNDKVTGNLRIGLFGSGTGVPDISVSAHSEPGTTAARGIMKFRNIVPSGEGTGGDVTVDVTCMYVEGTRALVAGVFRDGAEPFGPDFTFPYLVVEDNGQPNGPVPDRGDASAAGGQVDCTAQRLSINLGFPFVRPLVHGNVVVTDAD